MASCPGLDTCRNHFRQLDHVNLWVPAPARDMRRPFLLFHPYSSEISDGTRRYAEAHGLDVGSFPEFGDDWYGHSTIPIRLTVPENWPLWPIEAKAAALFSTQPIGMAGGGPAMTRVARETPPGSGNWAVSGEPDPRHPREAPQFECSVCGKVIAKAKDVYLLSDRRVACWPCMAKHDLDTDRFGTRAWVATRLGIRWPAGGAAVVTRRWPMCGAPTAESLS